MMAITPIGASSATNGPAIMRYILRDGGGPATITDMNPARIVTKKNPKPEYARLGSFAGYYFNDRLLQLSSHGAGGLMKAAQLGLVHVM